MASSTEQHRWFEGNHSLSLEDRQRRRFCSVRQTCSQQFEHSTKPSFESTNDNSADVGINSEIVEKPVSNDQRSLQEFFDRLDKATNIGRQRSHSNVDECHAQQPAIFVQRSVDVRTFSVDSVFSRPRTIKVSLRLSRRSRYSFDRNRTRDIPQRAALTIFTSFDARHGQHQFGRCFDTRKIDSSSRATFSIGSIRFLLVSTQQIRSICFQVGSFIQQLIVSQTSFQERKAMVASIIRCAITCWYIGNFNSAMQILAGLKFVSSLVASIYVHSRSLVQDRGFSSTLVNDHRRNTWIQVSHRCFQLERENCSVLWCCQSSSRYSNL